jgi:hypothetical protein
LLAAKNRVRRRLSKVGDPRRRAGQRIVIDGKVSLTAFEEHVNASNDDDRIGHLEEHLNSIKNHIKTLSSKAYQVHTNGGVDYVIMFVPIEGALAMALQEDPNMTSDAVGMNVNLATPTTVMIALRTAASVWQVERRNLNGEAIAARASQLYDKFVGFTDDDHPRQATQPGTIDVWGCNEQTQYRRWEFVTPGGSFESTRSQNQQDDDYQRCRRNRNRTASAFNPSRDR